MLRNWRFLTKRHFTLRKLTHQDISCNNLIWSRSLYSKSLVRQKTQYTYDHKTDSFHPKQNDDDNNRYNNNNDNKQRDFWTFSKSAVRNVALITGALVWGGVIFVSLFVEIKEEDLSELDVDLFKEAGNQGRLLAFFDLAFNKDELLSMLNFDKSKGTEVIETAHDKGKAFLTTLAHLKENVVLKEHLGEPIQLCGYRAAMKFNRAVQDIPPSSFYNKKNQWDVEYVIEGTKAMAVVKASFHRKNSNEPWQQNYVKVSLLESYNIPLIEEDS